MRRFIRLGGLLAALPLTACNTPGAPSAATTTATAAVQPESILLEEALVRLAPSDQAYVPHPLGGPEPVTNRIARLHRGMRARIRQVQGDWSEIELQNGTEGWVRSHALVAAKGMQDATLLADVPYYEAADPTTKRGTLARGTLLLYRGLQPDLTQVHLENQGWAWVETRGLGRDADDIAVAYLLIEARLAIAQKDMDEASALLDEARLKHANSSLVGLLAEQLDFLFLHATPRRRTSGHVTNVPALAGDIP